MFAFTLPFCCHDRTSLAGSRRRAYRYQSANAPSIVTFIGAPPTYDMFTFMSVSVTGTEATASGWTDETRSPTDAFAGGVVRFAVTMNEAALVIWRFKTNEAAGVNGCVPTRVSPKSRSPLPFWSTYRFAS